MIFAITGFYAAILGVMFVVLRIVSGLLTIAVFALASGYVLWAGFNG